MKQNQRSRQSRCHTKSYFSLSFSLFLLSLFPTSYCSQPHLVYPLVPLSFCLLLGEHQTAVGPVIKIMRAEGLVDKLQL